MKRFRKFITEKLKITSKTKINSKSTDIANYLGIEEKYAQEIVDYYLNKKYFDDLDNIYEKDLLATQFELVFMCTSMLVADNQPIESFTSLGYKAYKNKKGGTYNPYDYSWFEEEFSDQDNDYPTLLDYMQEKFANNKKTRENIRDAYDFCKKADINDPDKIFDIYEIIQN